MRARTRVGGHVGFSTYELLLGKSTSWMDLVAVDWFEAFQMQKPVVCSLEEGVEGKGLGSLSSD
jgi:hypothetical protein